MSEMTGVPDVVTSAMVNHFAREISKGSLSLWPQFIGAGRRYFNVTHGYVVRKLAWQLLPLSSTKKKSGDGELGGEKDWASRIVEGLEADIEEPDMYMPLMGFVTYVLLCGLVKGLQEQFHPDVLSATMTFALVLLVVEATVVKAVMFTAGAVNTPTVDLIALLAYKYVYLSMVLIFGLLIGHGHRPAGFLYSLVSLGLVTSCGVALWQALRRLARMQPAHGQACVSDVHSLVIKVVPVGQAFVFWLLLPSWPKEAAVPLAEKVASIAVAAAVDAPAAVVETTTTLAEIATTTLQALADAASAGAA